MITPLQTLYLIAYLIGVILLTAGLYLVFETGGFFAGVGIALMCAPDITPWGDA